MQAVHCLSQHWETWGAPSHGGLSSAREGLCRDMQQWALEGKGLPPAGGGPRGEAHRTSAGQAISCPAVHTPRTPVCALGTLKDCRSGAQPGYARTRASGICREKRGRCTSGEGSLSAGKPGSVRPCSPIQPGHLSCCFQALRHGRGGAPWGQRPRNMPVLSPSRAAGISRKLQPSGGP